MGRVAKSIQQMSLETISDLQELVHALRDSINCHKDAAKVVDDDEMKSTFRSIAAERAEIAQIIDSMVDSADGERTVKGTTLGSLRNTWLVFRGGLNGGNPKVVLIEAERAENAIIAKFRKILPLVAGSPVSAKLKEVFARVKSGRDKVATLRTEYVTA